MALAVQVQPSLVPSALLCGWLSVQYISAPSTEKWNRVLKLFGWPARAGASITTTITSAENTLTMRGIILPRSARRQCLGHPGQGPDSGRTRLASFARERAGA